MSLTAPTGPNMGPPPESNAPAPNRWRGVALGFGLGCLIFAVLRGLESLFLHGACEGRTLWALLAPLLLGPGGIAYATMNVGKGNGRAALGVGLALSSLFPALAFGVRDIGTLRTQGCAGGYVVFSEVGGGKLPQLVLKAGESKTVEVRPSGFNMAQPDNIPPFVRLKVMDGGVQGGEGVLTTQFAQDTVNPNEAAKLTITVSPQAPKQQYTLTVAAQQGPKQADGQLTVTIR